MARPVTGTNPSFAAQLTVKCSREEKRYLTVRAVLESTADRPLRQSDIARRAIQEYMTNHPLSSEMKRALASSQAIAALTPDGGKPEPEKEKTK